MMIYIYIYIYIYVFLREQDPQPSQLECGFVIWICKHFHYIVTVIIFKLFIINMPNCSCMSWTHIIIIIIIIEKK